MMLEVSLQAKRLFTFSKLQLEFGTIETCLSNRQNSLIELVVYCFEVYYKHSNLREGDAIMTIKGPKNFPFVEGNDPLIRTAS